MNPTLLRRQGAERVEKARAIQKAAEADDGRDLNEEELAQIEEHIAESKELFRQAEELERRQDTLSALNTAEAELDEPVVPRQTDVVLAGELDTVVRDQDERESFGFEGLGDFGAAVMAASSPGADFAMDPRLHQMTEQMAASGMSQGVGSDGGFAVPPTFGRNIWRNLQEMPDSLLDLTDRYPVDGAYLELPAVDESSRVNGSRYGGIQGLWRAEVEQMTPSKPKIRKLRIEPSGLYVFAYMTDDLMRNNRAALGQFLSNAATDELAFKIGDAIFEGDGVGKPLGVLNSGAKITVSKETGQAANTFTEQNVADMWVRLHSRARAGAVWLINQDVDVQLLTMARVVKNVAGTENVGGFAVRLYDPESDTLLGRPIRRVEYANTIGDHGDVVLTNLGFYATGTRGGVRSAQSIHLRFDYNETAFRWLIDLDGKCWLDSPITPFKGSNTVSPIVALEARA